MQIGRQIGNVVGAQVILKGWHAATLSVEHCVAHFFGFHADEAGAHACAVAARTMAAITIHSHIGPSSLYSHVIGRGNAIGGCRYGC